MLNFGQLMAQEWHQTGSDLGLTGAAGSEFSTNYSLAFNDSGETLLIGSPQYSSETASNIGQTSMLELVDEQWLITANFVGEEHHDFCGSSIAMSADGTTIAMTYQTWDDVRVKVFAFDGNAWQQKGDNFTGSFLYGRDLALSDDGNALVIGISHSPADQGIEPNIETYDWDGNSWVQRGSGLVFDYYSSGQSVSISGDGSTIAIAAPEAMIGFVRVLFWNGSDWIQLGNDHTGETFNSRFGTDIELNEDGTVLAVGSPNLETSEELSYVEVYEWDDGAWTQMGTQIQSDLPGVLMGGSIGLSSEGDRLVIGELGAASVYELSGNDWQQMGSSVVGDNVADEFGTVVSINGQGDRIAVGSNFANGDLNQEGYIRVFSLLTNTDIDRVDFHGRPLLYPNPGTAGEFISVRAEALLEKYELVNISGIVVRAVTVDAALDFKIRLPEVPGSYLLRLFGKDGRSVSQKVLVQ